MMKKLSTCLVPRYARHVDGRARAGGRHDYNYFGRHGTVESRAAYDRWTRQWLAGQLKGGCAPKLWRPAEWGPDYERVLTVRELVRAFLRFQRMEDGEAWWEGEEGTAYREIMGALDARYAPVAAAVFGEDELRKFREGYTGGDRSPAGIRRVTRIVRHAFETVVGRPPEAPREDRTKSRPGFLDEWGLDDGRLGDDLGPDGCLWVRR